MGAWDSKADTHTHTHLSSGTTGQFSPPRLGIIYDTKPTSESNCYQSTQLEYTTSTQHACTSEMLTRHAQQIARDPWSEFPATNGNGLRCSLIEIMFCCYYYRVWRSIASLVLLLPLPLLLLLLLSSFGQNFSQPIFRFCWRRISLRSLILVARTYLGSSEKKFAYFEPNSRSLESLGGLFRLADTRKSLGRDATRCDAM